MADRAASVQAPEIVTALRRHYGCEVDGIGPEWAALDEMDLQPGFSTRRIDLLVWRAWSGGKRGHERHAIEVKVSRDDLRRELDQPEKWGAWAAVTHRFYLAVPAALDLSGLALPDSWGLYTVTGEGVRRARAAAHNYAAEPLPERFHVEAFRRASRAEARIRQADGDDLPARIAALERDLLAAQRQTATAREAERRWRTHADDALDLLARAVPAPACRCGAPLKRLRRGSMRWEHDGEPGVDEFALRESPPCWYPMVDTGALAESLLPVPALSAPYVPDGDAS